MSIGVTGIVLKYRVPYRDPDRRWLAAMQDAQRPARNRHRLGPVGLPLADIITTAADFEQFKAAHALRQEGDVEAADEIFAALGMPAHKRKGSLAKRHSWREELTHEQAAAFMVAQAANDRDAMDAIMEEAGIVRGDRSSAPKYLRDGRVLD